MIVYIVTYNSWESYAYESDFTQLRAVFDTEQQALDYVKNHSHETYDNKYNGSYFEIEPIELNNEIK